MSQEKMRTKELADRVLFISKIVDEITLGIINDKIYTYLKEILRMSGYVYVLHVKDNLYKLGATDNFERRYKELGLSKIPTAVFQTNKPYILEKFLQNKFAHKRLMNEQEIFSFDDQDLLYLITYLYFRRYHD